LGKLNRRPQINVVDITPPLCACGCLKHVKWNKQKKRWNKYIVGHAAKGKKRTPEMNEKNRQRGLGKSPSPDTRELLRTAMTGRVFTEEHLENLRQNKIEFYQLHPEKAMKGTKNSGYVDGRCSSGDYKYSKDFNERLKELIRDRDDRQCQICYRLESDLSEKLNVHHIDYTKINADLDNLVSLCRVCHGKTSRDRDKWIAFFQSKRQLFLIEGGQSGI